MKTFIYMVRHGESSKTEDTERTRGLTDKGRLEARLVHEFLKDEGIDRFISSPYKRATLTIEESAKHLGKEIVVLEDLRELVFLNDDKISLSEENVC